MNNTTKQLMIGCELIDHDEQSSRFHVHGDEAHVNKLIDNDA